MGKWEIVCMKVGAVIVFVCVHVCVALRLSVLVYSTAPSRMSVYFCVCARLWLRHNEEV